MNMRSWYALTAVALIAGLSAGCSSSAGSTSSANPTPSATGSQTGAAVAAERLTDGGALIVQCALTQGLMKPPTGLTTPAGQTPFVQGKKLVITSANAGAFNNWYSGIIGTTIAGQAIEQWAEQVASSGKLPAAVCGTSVTTSELQKQVFAGDPAAANPWG
jgi:uncharacterized membrane protein YeaQ/YmgE (transglycosylase-associated protein family)